jgi:Coenzyme PQQ synthesis protein D (PqqD)
MSKKRASSARQSQDPLAGLRRRPDVPVRQHGLDLAVYDPASKRVHVLSPVAAALWHQLTPDRTFEQVHEMLALTFPNAKSAKIGRDLKASIKKLRQLNLLIAKTGRVPKRSKKQPAITVPGTTINHLARGYEKPAIKTFTVPQLNRAVEKAVRLKIFCDLMPAPDRER